MGQLKGEGREEKRREREGKGMVKVITLIFSVWVLSRLSCPSCLVLLSSGHPVLSFLSCLSYLDYHLQSP